MKTILWIITLLTILLNSNILSQPDGSASSVRINTDECDAVRNLIEIKQSNETITDEDWNRVFYCEGFHLWKKRNEIFHAGESETGFKKYIQSDTLTRHFDSLLRSIDEVESLDPESALNKALAYLPSGTTITATIYPLIVQRPEAYVAPDAHFKPAVFVTLTPDRSVARIENLISHELFHIGYSRYFADAIKQALKDTTLPSNYLAVIREVSKLNEGMAMLAAAGGPDIHPHATSTPNMRESWDNDLLNYTSGFNRVEAVILDLINEKVTERELENNESQAHRKLFYSVGWNISTTIENMLGREKLIECVRDPRKVPSVYNQAASKANHSINATLPFFSDQLVLWFDRTN